MPLYEYECAACHKRVEKIQKFSDPELTECAHCGGKLERVLSAPAVSFKGGGWYADLYSSSKKSSGSGKAESSGSASSGDSGSASSSNSSSGSSSSTGSAAGAPAASSGSSSGSTTKS